MGKIGKALKGRRARTLPVQCGLYATLFLSAVAVTRWTTGREFDGESAAASQPFSGRRSLLTTALSGQFDTSLGADGGILYEEDVAIETCAAALNSNHDEDDGWPVRVVEEDDKYLCECWDSTKNSTCSLEAFTSCCGYPTDALVSCSCNGLYHAEGASGAAVIAHVLGILYMFLGLCTVRCLSFFCFF
jgi:hypothetical protein